MVRSKDDPLAWREAAGGHARNARAHIDQTWLSSGESVEFPATGVTAIVGANNSGKSTLLRQLNSYLMSGSAGLANEDPQLLQSIQLTRNLRLNDLIHWFAKNAILIEQGELSGGDYFSLNGQNYAGVSLRAGHYEHVVNNLQDFYSAFVSFADAASRLHYGFAGQGKNEFDDPPQSTLQRFVEDRSLFESLSQLAIRIFGRPLMLDDQTSSSIRIRVGNVELGVPGRDEPLGDYGHAVRGLPLLDAQGDGMKSFFGLMIPVLAEARQIILVDEPEAFLHPPQARALGRELGRTSYGRGQQIVVATHSKDFLSGLLDSEAELTVVRLQRDEKTTRRTQPTRDTLVTLRDDRLLRYSNILNGLFAQLVVLCESEQDCRFYEAALDHYISVHAADPTVHTLPAADVLFIPANGKGGFVNFLPSLKQLAVPTAVVADLDLLKSEQQAKALFETLDGAWADARRDFTAATHSLRKPARPRSVSFVLEAVNSVLGPKVAQDPTGIYDGDARQVVEDLLRAADDPWVAAKKIGVPAFSGHALLAIRSLTQTLDAKGLILVQVGELEGFARQFAKNREWLPNAIASEAYASAPAQELISRMLLFHGTMTAN